MRKYLFASVLLIACVTGLFAAATYPAPAIPAGKNCVITNDNAQFTMTRNGDNTIQTVGKGEYNYDNAWSFTNIIVHHYWLDQGGNLVFGPGTVFGAPEAGSIAVLGKWSVNVQLPNLPNGTDVNLKAKITIQKTIPVNNPQPGQPPPPPQIITDSADSPVRTKTVPNRN